MRVWLGIDELRLHSKCELGFMNGENTDEDEAE